MAIQVVLEVENNGASVLESQHSRLYNAFRFADLAYALIPLPEGTKEPIWIETAQNYLVGIIIDVGRIVSPHGFQGVIMATASDWTIGPEENTSFA